MVCRGLVVLMDRQICVVLAAEEALVVVAVLVELLVSCI